MSQSIYGVYEFALEKVKDQIVTALEGFPYRLDDSTNLRLVTISGERRQQIIEAVRAFKQKSSELSINN